MVRSDRRPGYMLPLRSNGYFRLGYHRQTSLVDSVVVMRHEVDIYWTWLSVVVGVCCRMKTESDQKRNTYEKQEKGEWNISQALGFYIGGVHHWWRWRGSFRAMVGGRRPPVCREWDLTLKHEYEVEG